MVGADVVEVGVAGNGNGSFSRNQGYLFSELHHAHPAVDEHVGRAANNMPDIAAIEFLDIRLSNQGDAVIEVVHGVPVFG